MNRTTDPISDMLTRIRNANLVNKLTIVLPYSNINYQIAQVLVEYKFIVSANDLTDKEIGFRQIKLVIANEKTNPAISELKRISKPGRRVYVGYDKIPVIKNGRGMVILSTTKGIISGQKARELKLGGELLASIY